MSGETKEGLTLPWLWVAVIMALLALGFMLPPLDAPLKTLAKTKIHMQAPDDAKAQSQDLVF
ncbi:MAG: hypothetical protein P8Y63_06965 [Deltaproteobacteria bacterium]|jgi:hypothetical protein